MTVMATSMGTLTVTAITMKMFFTDTIDTIVTKTESEVAGFLIVDTICPKMLAIMAFVKQDTTNLTIQEVTIDIDFDIIHL